MKNEDFALRQTVLKALVRICIATTISHTRTRRAITATHKVHYRGSNVVRSYLRQKRNSIYEEIVRSHYVRPLKRISYSKFFSDDGSSVNRSNVKRSGTNITC